MCQSKSCSFLPDYYYYYYQHWGPTRESTISPVIFTLYTNECKVNSSDVFNVKSVDDTAIVGFITKDETKYRGSVDELLIGAVLVLLS